MSTIVITSTGSSLHSKETCSEISVPQDKSIFHRILILAALSESQIFINTIGKLSSDVLTTLNALVQLGVKIDRLEKEIIVYGVGKKGFKKPSEAIDCGNSGTTARLLMGLLASQSFESILIGDASLSKRPMARLATILNQQLGADILCSDNGTLPVKIRGKALHEASVVMPVASAQMKSSILLAAYCSNSAIEISEPSASRNHTEKMMISMGIDVQVNTTSVLMKAHRSIQIPSPYWYQIPGDVSSAAFFVVASVITKTNLRIKNVGLNPTRLRFFELLSDSGVPLFYENVAIANGELYGDMIIDGSKVSDLKPFVIETEDVPNLQDEIPALAVLALFAEGKSVIRGASELRLKESDRIKAMIDNLHRIGGRASELPDGLEITGSNDFIPSGAIINSYYDHRIAMAMAVAALKSSGVVTIPDASVVSISSPTFFELLGSIPAASMISITE